MTIRHLSASGVSLALHLLAGLLVAWLPWGATRPHLAPTVGFASAEFVPSADASTKEPDPSAVSPDAVGDPDGGSSLIDVSSTEVTVAGFRFDFGKVARRSKLLFPFLTRGLPLDLFPRPVDAARDGPFVSPFRPASAPARSSKPPLVLSNTAFQELIDRAWARRERWADFQPLAAFVHAHHPDQGRLPELLQAYTDQNLLQPYVDPEIRDPRLWTMLAVAADALDFVEFINGYVAAHAGTRAATELLFLLDELVQGNHDGLATLLDTHLDQDLWWTRQTSRVAYDVMTDIQAYYREELARRRIATASALRAYYDEVRLAVLTRIVRTTPNGYRASDARFLIGGIYWRQGRTAAAVRWWRDMTVGPKDSYVTAYAEILDVLRFIDLGRNGVAKARVDGILASEHQRWLRTSTARLRDFGYEVDEF